MNTCDRLHQSARYRRRATCFRGSPLCRQFGQHGVDDLHLQIGKMPLENLRDRTLNDFVEFLCHSQKAALI